MLGIGPESDGLWKQVLRQAQTYFKSTVGRENLNVGFLLQALQYHGGFKLKNVMKERPFFKANNIFSRSDF
jgi:hypothetical protein